MRLAVWKITMIGAISIWEVPLPWLRKSPEDHFLGTEERQSGKRMKRSGNYFRNVTDSLDRGTAAVSSQDLSYRPCSGVRSQLFNQETSWWTFAKVTGISNISNTHLKGISCFLWHNHHPTKHQIVFYGFYKSICVPVPFLLPLHICSLPLMDIRSCHLPWDVWQSWSRAGLYLFSPLNTCGIAGMELWRGAGSSHRDLAKLNTSWVIGDRHWVIVFLPV